MQANLLHGNGVGDRGETGLFRASAAVSPRNVRSELQHLAVERVLGTVGALVG